MSDRTRKKNAGPGPEADRLIIEGDWRDAVKRAVSVKRPADGWPKPEKTPAKAKKAARKTR